MPGHNPQAVHSCNTIPPVLPLAHLHEKRRQPVLLLGLDPDDAFGLGIEGVVAPHCLRQRACIARQLCSIQLGKMLDLEAPAVHGASKCDRSLFWLKGWLLV